VVYFLEDSRTPVPAYGPREQYESYAKGFLTVQRELVRSFW
jgi:hypothetical protein